MRIGGPRLWKRRLRTGGQARPRNNLLLLVSGKQHQRICISCRTLLGGLFILRCASLVRTTEITMENRLFGAQEVSEAQKGSGSDTFEAYYSFVTHVTVLRTFGTGDGRSTTLFGRAFLPPCNLGVCMCVCVCVCVCVCLCVSVCACPWPCVFLLSPLLPVCAPGPVPLPSPL